MNFDLSRRGVLAGTVAAALSVVPAASAAAASPRSDARARLRDLETSYDGRIGAFALDTATGATVTYRAHERFPLLSTFKALAAAAILRKARRCDPGLLDRLIRWTAADILPNSPITAQHVDTGLTVAQLCEAAITVSDNTAGNMLLRQLGGPPGVTRFAGELGDPVTRLDRTETDLNIWSPGQLSDTTAPAAVGRDLAAVTVGRALVAEDQARLIGWLRGNLTGGARIRAGLPPTWTVGDKTGSGPTYGSANDIAIAWPPSAAPLILAVYTNRNAADAAFDNHVIATTATILAQALGKL
ncbi:MAG: beta-lactamase class [Micromonosporaceae bacterium]